MDSALLVHRLHFAFTVTFHYLFPQLTMGLAPLIVVLKTLGMEGMFAFFLASAFLGVFLYGEKRLSPRAHWWSAVAVFLGSWLSGFFIVATDAWLQHPVGYAKRAEEHTA